MYFKTSTGGAQRVPPPEGQRPLAEKSTPGRYPVKSRWQPNRCLRHSIHTGKGGVFTEKEYLSITELAKIRKISSETLRYYDRIGLLKPKYIDPETHYRYYSMRQSETLGAIRELRDIGMSIKDIQRYFTDCNLEQSIRLFHEHFLLLQREAEEKLAYSRIIAEKLAYLSNLAAMKDYGNPVLTHMPERKIITFGKQTNNQKEHVYALTQLEWYLDSVAPTLATDRIGVYGGPDMLEESDEYVKSTPMIIAETSTAEPEYVRTVPESDYLCMVYSGGRFGRYNPVFKVLKDYIAENGYEIAGDIFHVYKIDVTLTHDRSETLLELQVPVRKHGESDELTAQAQ